MRIKVRNYKIFAEKTREKLGKNKLNFLDLNEFKISESEEFIIR